METERAWETVKVEMNVQSSMFAGKQNKEDEQNKTPCGIPTRHHPTQELFLGV